MGIDQAASDSATFLRRQPPRPAAATSIKERKCAACPRRIPVGETHVYDGDRTRWHVECYR